MSAILLAKCNMCGYDLNDQWVVRRIPHKKIPAFFMQGVFDMVSVSALAGFQCI